MSGALAAAILLQSLLSHCGPHVTRLSSLHCHANLLSIVHMQLGTTCKLLSGATTFSHPTLAASSCEVAATFASPHSLPRHLCHCYEFWFQLLLHYINSYSKVWRTVTSMFESRALIAHHSHHSSDHAAKPVSGYVPQLLHFCNCLLDLCSLVPVP